MVQDIRREPPPRESRARLGITYRAARRNEARQRQLVWRELPAYQGAGFGRFIPVDPRILELLHAR